MANCKGVLCIPDKVILYGIITESKKKKKNGRCHWQKNHYGNYFHPSGSQVCLAFAEGHYTAFLDFLRLDLQAFDSI